MFYRFIEKRGIFYETSVVCAAVVDDAAYAAAGSGGRGRHRPVHGVSGRNVQGRRGECLCVPGL